METTRSKLFISTEELSTLLANQQEPQIVNATMYMPSMKKDPWQEHLEGRITSNTVFFDHDIIKDPDNQFEHALPSLEVWINHMKRLNVQSDIPIVCYDSQGMFSVARAAWMFRYFGASNVRILNGGLKQWTAEGKKLESGDQPKNGDPVSEGTFDYHVPRPEKVITDIKVMHGAAYDLYHKKEGATQVVDARAAARFNGEVAEPRPECRSGSIKNSLNVPFTMLVNADTGMMKSDEEIKQAFEAQGVNLDKPIINTCGSGVTASVLELGQQILGRNDSVIYDGSWCEYGQVEEPDFDKK